MHSKSAIRIVECHAEGEVGDVIVGGVAPPPGETLWAQSRYIAEDETLRNFVLNEPRGGVFRHVNLLVPPTDPEAAAAWFEENRQLLGSDELGALLRAWPRRPIALRPSGCAGRCSPSLARLCLRLKKTNITTLT